MPSASHGFGHLQPLPCQNLTADQLRTQGAREIQVLEERLMDARKEGLKELVQSARTTLTAALADSSLTAALADSSLTAVEREAAARARVRDMEFGENNYVFLFSRDYQNLAFRPDPTVENQPAPDPELFYQHDMSL